MILLYLGTGALILCAIALIIATIKLTDTSRAMLERDGAYIKRFNAIESLIKQDIGNILKILKQKP